MLDEWAFYGNDLPQMLSIWQYESVPVEIPKIELEPESNEPF